MKKTDFLRKVIFMKSQKSNIQSMIALLLLCSSLILGGCGTNLNVNVTSSTEEPSELIAATETQSEATVAPVVTSAVIPTIASTAIPTIMVGTVLEDAAKDIDGNGVTDNLQIISLNNDGGETCLQVYLNEEKIFEYEDPLVTIMGVGAFEYLDLDGDNTNEIFITASTNTNCRPYAEVLCLKQIDGKWNQMDLPKNEEGNNQFSFKITRGKDEFDFIISSDDTNQIIHYDASQYFKDDESGNFYSIQEYRKNNYKEGNEVGFIAAWGIHDAKTGTYKGRNCIIANQGIEGPYGHGLGEVNIYFAYNEQGKVDILNIEYLPL